MSAEINLSPERALIFRITHIDNVPWILDHGLHCRNSSTCDPHFRAIGNPELIAKRRHWEIPLSPGGTLGDYVPFYFTPHTPMLYNIKTGYQGTPRMPMSSIVILASSLHRVLELGGRFVFADRHALLQAAVFSDQLEDLEKLDWRSLRARNFRRDDEDPGRIERYQAEALIHQSMPVAALSGLACYGQEQEQTLAEQVGDRHLDLKVRIRPRWYF